MLKEKSKNKKLKSLKTAYGSTGNSKNRINEGQGPIDWTHIGIKTKYRGEVERENAWNEWLKNQAIAKKLLQDMTILPVVKIERHPLYQWFFNRIREENSTADSRTKSRLLMKRFVFDVQEIWLSNLEHLQEHKPNNGTENVISENGLIDRRDSKSIVELQHQIQSVSQKRVFSNAYHTSKLPQINVILDYRPDKTPNLDDPKLRPPLLQKLCHKLTYVKRLENFCLVDSSPCDFDASFIIEIDRLLPPPELGIVIGQDILWRFSICQTSTLKFRSWICLENDIANFIAQLTVKNNSNMMISSKVLVFRKSNVTVLTMEGQEIESEIEITVCRQKLDNYFQFDPIRIIISLSSSLFPSPIFLQLSPLEIKQLLSGTTFPILDFEWWISEERKEIWTILLSFLAIEKIIENSLEYYNVIISSKEFIDNALTLPQCFSCVNELLSVINLHIKPNQILPDIAFFFDSYSLPLMPLPERSLFQNEYLYRKTFEYTVENIKRLVYSGLWENLLDISYNSSFLANNLYNRITEVPGASEFGRNGLWFQDHLHPELEMTQVSAKFLRDSARSISDAILVDLSLCLDTCVLFKPEVAWESYALSATAALNEEIEETIPFWNPKPFTLLVQNLISPLQNRPSNTVIIFSSYPVEGVDYSSRSTLNLPKGFKRFVPRKNQYGYREQIEVKLLAIDSVVDSQVYGITRKGVLFNKLDVNNRNVWHNSIAINENINRPRTSKDYFYIIKNLLHCGTNIPTSYTTRMRALEMVGLTSSAFSEFEDNYKKILDIKSIFHKQVALEAKIEKIENDIKIKQENQKRLIQDKLQRSLEKRLNKATKSEKGWRSRFSSSSIVEIQGNWERRRDKRTGLYFFHKITSTKGEEKYLDTCQWEIPSTWEGEVFQQINRQLKSDTLNSQKDGKFIEQQTAFQEPSSVWEPGTNSIPMIEKKQRKMSTQSEISDLDSVLADRSLAESDAPTIDTANLEHIAEQLVSSDELMRVLARRLGIPESQIIGADELSSLFSTTSSTKNFDTAKREGNSLFRNNETDDDERENFDSDDDLWSDNDDEVGDVDYVKEISAPEDLTTNQLEAANMKRRMDKELDVLKSDIQSVPSKVPFVDLTGILGEYDSQIEKNEQLYAWRRLPRPNIGKKFLSNALKTQTLGPDKFSCNTINSPVFLMPISPVDACKYVPDHFTLNVESLFIPDAKRDMERSIATLERNIKREEELSRNMPTDDLLLFGEAKEFTSVDAFLAKQYKDDKAAVANPQEAAQERAILAAKSTNIAQMEDALAEDIPINTADEFGNTLLILAAQQGSKRMCKFLLRKGASINLQNLTGNTVLHYCYAYSNNALGEYLKSKGADDSILNVDGLTCYEGLNRQSMNQQYADYNEDDYAD